MNFQWLRGIGTSATNYPISFSVVYSAVSVSFANGDYTVIPPSTFTIKSLIVRNSANSSNVIVIGK